MDATTSADAGPATGSPTRRGVLGLDRRGRVGTLAVLAVVLFYAAVLPLVDALVPTTDGATPSGGSIAVTDSGRATVDGDSGPGIAIDPAAGWEFVDPRCTTACTLRQDATTLDLTLVGGDRSVDDLLSEARRRLDRDHAPITVSPSVPVVTEGGAPGRLATFEGITVAGEIAVIDLGGAMLRAVSLGPASAARAEERDEVVAMVRSARRR